jgi:hypothetical protein
MPTWRHTIIAIVAYAWTYLIFWVLLVWLIMQLTG